MEQPSGRRRAVITAVIGLSVVVLLAASVWAWIEVPVLYTGVADEAARVQAIVTTRASVLAALAGLGALVTIAINYRNSRTAAATLATTNETFRITARGHLTDRYTKAIEQLGNEESLGIRLGGIYALQQFAVETDRDQDQTTVVEVLSAFVRTRLPRRDGADPRAEIFLGPVFRAAEPDPDVLAAISTLAQLPTRLGVEMRADFSGVDFAQAHLGRARLTGSNLYAVDLRGADLRGADLSDADLSYTNLAGADLRDTSLIDASLYSADLVGADLRGASLMDADLTAADLTDADLQGASLQRANLAFCVMDPGHLSVEQRASARNAPAQPGESAPN